MGEMGQQLPSPIHLVRCYLICVVIRGSRIWSSLHQNGDFQGVVFQEENSVCCSGLGKSEKQVPTHISCRTPKLK